MKHSILIISLSLITILNLYSQQTLTSRVNQDKLRTASIFSERSNQGSSTSMNLYNSEDFILSTIILGSEEIVDSVMVKLDFHNKKLLFKDQETVFEIENLYIDKVVLGINSSNTFYYKFIINQKAQLGELLTADTQNISFISFRFTDSYVQKADYNPVLGIGNKEDKVVEKNSYGIWDKNNMELYLLPKSKRKCKKYLQNLHLGLPKETISSLNPNNENSIIEFTKHLNNQMN